MQPTMQLIRQAIKAWPRNSVASRAQTRALRLGYIKARIVLGDKWLLAIPVQKKETSS